MRRRCGALRRLCLIGGICAFSRMKSTPISHFRSKGIYGFISLLLALDAMLMLFSCSTADSISFHWKIHERALYNEDNNFHAFLSLESTTNMNSCYHLQLENPLSSFLRSRGRRNVHSASSEEFWKESPAPDTKRSLKIHFLVSRLSTRRTTWFM